MRRFLAFPLLLGFIGTLFPLLVFEGLLPVVPVILRSGGSPFSPPPDVVESMWQSSLWIGVLGVFLGFILGVFDLVLNRRKRREARQLVGNILWCSIYAQGVIAVDAVIVFSSVWYFADELWKNSAKTPIVLTSCCLPILLCFTAAGWGAIRTVSRDDILSPRVLRSKLKRSSRIEG